jgi:sugar lactone lactonase YvrE
LATGFGIAEAPLVGTDDRLYFSDVRGGGVYALDAELAVTEVIPRRKGIGGMTLHADGGLVVAGRDLSHVRDGESETVLLPDDLPPSPGVASFTDFAVDPDGRILAGTVRMLDGERRAGGLWLIAERRRATLVYDDVDGSNGMAFSPDGKTLFHAESHRQRVRVTQCGPEGPLVETATSFSTASVDGVPDGLVVDADGNLWIGFYGGGVVGRFEPNGTLLELIELPGRYPTSLCFDSSSDSGLYVVSAVSPEGGDSDTGCVFHLEVGVSGAPLFLATV